MKIQSMFKDDINRKINGVVKVGQDEDSVLIQELEEYVITKELKKHFISFFNNYSDAFDEPTADVGVWISGFFGSGKSHFLKMLSYLLSNREVAGVKTVERFRDKFADDPASFMLIDRATRGKTDTILFNIDVEGSSEKNKTAVLRVFAKMFYTYLGFYGEDLKVAKLEQYIAKKGKTEEFQRVFEQKNGSSWLEERSSYGFLEDDIVATLHDVLGMSEQSARNWCNGPETVEISIAQLVSEIKEHVDAQPKDFRLLFMIDEVGQYVGEDTDMLLNLQSLVEELGSKCDGKVWVVCTGQEAIDEIIKARENEFSRIQARFKTRLSLSSSSADEVIQKRILHKKDDAEQTLEKVYADKDSVLRNLFTFTDDTRKDIKGYSGPEEFVKDFPFVPYQFILMQKVFTEIRKHGNSGKHLSGGERSMLSGFQEAAQKIADKNEYALAPFHLFYDTVHTFLDSSIRNVIERCASAAEAGDGVEPQDVDVLKLLYLVRYIDDVKANLDNIVILMADNIELDKVAMRKRVSASLDRLKSQNYIGLNGNICYFLTDEEQSIQREINNIPVEVSEVVNRIGQIVFDDIYTSKKFSHDRYVFPFERIVDEQVFGTVSNGLKLHLLTVASNVNTKDELGLTAKSEGQALVVLPDAQYYQSIESAMKIRKYVKTRDASQLPESEQSIIRNQNDQAAKHEEAAAEELKKAVAEAKVYVGGEKLEIKGGDAKSKLDQALDYLVSQVYSKLDLITDFAEKDEDIYKILDDELGATPNQNAAAEVEKYLEMQLEQKLTTTMADVQSRFQSKPYGWREIDIAAIVAGLIRNQKVIVKRGGQTIQPDDHKLPDMLRKKSEIGSTIVAKRQLVALQKLRIVKDFMRDYFNEMAVPQDEDGLVAYIAEKFGGALEHYVQLEERYIGHAYPDRDTVEKTITQIKKIMAQKKDNTALIQHLIDHEDELDDSRDQLQRVEDFFKNQVGLFDTAVEFVHELNVDHDYIAKNEKARTMLDQLRQIITVTSGATFNYTRIPELNGLMAEVKEAHDAMLAEKCKKLLDIVRQCTEALRTAADGAADAQSIVDEAEAFFSQKAQQIASCKTLTQLDSLVPQLWSRKDDDANRIEAALHPPVMPDKTSAPKKENIKQVYRQKIFPAKTLKTEDEIDAYVESIRASMKEELKDCDGIKVN